MWQTIDNLFSTLNMQLGLLVGTGVLAICLLVLALTRWGQSSPVWKCVILSFVAHILLMVYAYGTHLIFEYPDPGLASNSQLRVNVIAAADEAVETTEDETAIPDWANEALPEKLPEVVSPLERPEIDSELVIERKLPEREDLPEVQIPSATPQPVTMDEVPEIKPESPPALVELDRVLPKLESPEMPVERKQQPELTPNEPPRFSSADDFKEFGSDAEFKPSPSGELKNPHENGLDSNLLDPNAQFSAQPPVSQLPVPSMLPASVDPESRPASPDTRFKPVSSSWRAADGKPLPEVYSLRRAADRNLILQQRGGSEETEAAVQDGLRWLAQSQEADGRWDADRWGAGIEKQVFGHDRKGAGADADTGITGLATLALLAGGHSHFEGPYRQNIQRALDYLVRQQGSNGDLAGEARLFARTYCHSMALLALSEALAVTGDRKLASAVQKGVDYSVYSQNRQDGGWRYQPGDPGDMSQHGWQVLALKSARMGGAQVPAETYDRMRQFVNSCSSGSFGGLSSYRPRHQVSTSMTAEALVCRFVLDEEISYDTMMEAANRIATERPSALNINLYYWYYGTLAMYQVGGREWETWNTEMKRALLSMQVRTGDLAGSWSPDCLWGGYGGRVYSTALATLNLQVYYRYMPNQRTAAVVTKPGGEPTQQR